MKIYQQIFFLVPPMGTAEQDTNVDSDNSDAKVTGDLNKLPRRNIRSGMEIDNKYLTLRRLYSRY